MKIVEWNTKSAGDAEPDGTVYAGSLNGKAVFSAPADASLAYNFDGAAEYAERLNAEKFLGHDDWHVPTKDELNVLWENRDKGKLKGTFNETGERPLGCYLSSTPGNLGSGCVQSFSDGNRYDYYRHYPSSLRLVR